MATICSGRHQRRGRPPGWLAELALGPGGWSASLATDRRSPDSARGLHPEVAHQDRGTGGRHRDDNPVKRGPARASQPAGRRPLGRLIARLARWLAIEPDDEPITSPEPRRSVAVATELDATAATVIRLNRAHQVVRQEGARRQLFEPTGHFWADRIRGVMGDEGDA
jgi:hypothetical protein